MAAPDGGWARHLGSRVVLRVPAPGGRSRDVLGELVEVAPHRLRVRTRAGVVDVDPAAVLAGKPVPPAPVRAAPPHRALSTLGLETVAAGHWVPPDLERRGGWLFRAAEGFTNRANSVLPLGDPPAPPAEMVADVVAWYAARGLRPIAALPVPRADDPDGGPLVAARAAFAAAGWRERAGRGADVLVAATGELRGAGLEVPSGYQVRLLPEPDDAWLAGYHYRGQDLPAVGRRLLMSAPEQAFAAVRTAAGGTAAVGRGSLGGGWTGIAAVEVDPAHRRRGLARVVLGELCRWAWSRGARSVYLQVGDANRVARELYLDEGFELHHSYAYWSPQPDRPRQSGSRR